MYRVIQLSTYKLLGKVETKICSKMPTGGDRGRSSSSSVERSSRAEFLLVGDLPTKHSLALQLDTSHESPSFLQLPTDFPNADHAPPLQRIQNFKLKEL
ncbi:hypothetical protein AVEN_175249-1 [Araneus ventricosus]|uniref:Uncharacterized protein n=1 Tax=Araneus ventricosus TaxID=182803 RepID=A0A4Y2LIS8_ARAVE|nr:hypothetical protein AVEN_175249-1 [Araneus ventricosus]